MTYCHWTFRSKEHGTFYNFRFKTRKEFATWIGSTSTPPNEGDVIENNTLNKSYILNKGKWKKYL